MEITLETVVFYFLAAFITVFSILTVTTHRMVRSATYLLFVLFGTAGIYFLLGYTFLGSVQIMVYAGGIVVLYVFSILLTSGEGDVIEKLKRSRFLAGLGATVGGAIIVVFITLKHKFIATTDVEPLEVNIKTIGHHMLSGDKYGYLLPFEAVSILLLACISIELILNATDINFAVFNRFLFPGGLEGYFFSLFSIAISAAETAVAIAIMINIYRNIRSIQVNKLDEMKW